MDKLKTFRNLLDTKKSIQNNLYKCHSDILDNKKVL